MKVESAFQIAYGIVNWIAAMILASTTFLYVILSGHERIPEHLIVLVGVLSLFGIFAFYMGGRQNFARARALERDDDPSATTSLSTDDPEVPA